MGENLRPIGLPVVEKSKIAYKLQNLLGELLKKNNLKKLFPAKNSRKYNK
jgi:hypothetical protein